MAYENKPGDGVAFPNKYADQNPKAPKYRGHVFHHVTGERIELAIWEKTSKAGKPYLSIRASEPRSMTQEAYGEAPAPKGQASSAPLSDDIPFNLEWRV